MTDHSLRQTRAMESIAKSLSDLKDTTQETAVIFAKMQHPAYQGREIDGVKVLEDDISVAFSFELPDIQGTANFYRQDDGLLRVEILIAPEESARFLTLVDTMDVKSLTVEASG